MRCCEIEEIVVPRIDTALAFVRDAVSGCPRAHESESANPHDLCPHYSLRSTGLEKEKQDEKPQSIGKWYEETTGRTERGVRWCDKVGDTSPGALIAAISIFFLGVWKGRKIQRTMMSAGMS